MQVRLAETTAALLVWVLPGWAAGELDVRAQDEARVSLTRPLERADAELDLRRPARELYKPLAGVSTMAWNTGSGR